MYEPCPVCNSPYTAYIRDVPTARTHRDIPLFSCLACRSLWNPSGYREDEAQLQRDLQWGFSVKERNERAAAQLFELLGKEGIHPKSVVEIGCGIGTLLTVARDRGMVVTGFDVNNVAINYAREVNHLNVSTDFWTADTRTGEVDLYLCIMVLEHMESPRPLLENLCKAAVHHSAALFVSVPFVGPDKWHFILNPDPKETGTPFFDNDVHVTHFSVEGMISVFSEFGCDGAKLFRGGLWHGILWSPTRVS